jgi:UDP-N-acetylmuramoyl-L-alanyl-D-glutamate--2,6-diaminopimelate ligase
MTRHLKPVEPSRVIGDRRDAIAYAVSLCQPGDTLLILGKGHENGQEIKGQKIDFDDRLVLAQILEESR